MFSDYVVYVDESGDANLSNPNPSYPMFVLAFCVFRKQQYVSDVSPAIQRLKFKYFGHDAVVLHEREIRKQQQPFVFLKSLDKRIDFMNDLNALIVNSPMIVIAAAINKQRLIEKYIRPENPYNLALKFCMERLQKYLISVGQNKALTHLIFEARGHDEDRSLELEFRRIKDGQNFDNSRYENLDILFAHKRANSGGLQLADLIARPIGIKQLKPNQDNRAYELIESKFDRDRRGRFLGYGLKTFP